MRDLIYGVGFSSTGKNLRSINCEHTLTYKTWLGMLRRCYSKENNKFHKTYTGCSISENFKDFQFFAEWCNNQIGFGKEGWCLDKDILVKGNKIYSEDNCVFVPKQINLLLTDRASARGKFPLGVNYHKASRKYAASLWKHGKRVYLGLYVDPETAFQVYKKEKESHIKDIANMNKDVIDPRVYNALISWCITP